jgi:HD superfamily phosphohydrolase
MKEVSRVRDPVHNFIELTEEEVKLLATPLLQRLRRIRQLAMASLVYPGALHTRFDHTLGVCHIAGLIAKRLGLKDHEIKLVRFAALLHDLGHGPFSHVSEHVLERYAKRDTLLPDQKKEKIHELVTAHLIENDKDIVRLVGQGMCGQIVKLLSEGHGQAVLRSIVSGPLDADKQDYLLRDSYFCGVKYGVFDIHQLHRSFTLVGSEDDEYLAIDPDGVHALEQYVLAKYYLTTNVYRHRVRMITDQMIVRAIILGIDEDGLDELRAVYAFDNSDEFFERYVEWDDARLMLAFGDGDTARPNTLCGKLFGSLRRRVLHKQVYSKRLQDIADPEVCEKLLAISNPKHDGLRKQIEEAVAGILEKYLEIEVDKRLVIVHGFNIQSVRTVSRNDESSITIAGTPEQTKQPFEEYSALFRSIKEGYTDGSVEVYAPITWETRADRRRIRDRLREPIQKAIMKLTEESLKQEETEKKADHEGS